MVMRVSYDHQQILQTSTQITQVTQQSRCYKNKERSLTQQKVNFCLCELYQNTNQI